MIPPIENRESGLSARQKINQSFIDLNSAEENIALVQDDLGTFKLSFSVTREFDSVSELLLDTQTYPEGAYLRVSPNNFIYQVADVSASDNHLVNQGGTKLYVITTRELAAFAPEATGAVDVSTKVSAWLAANSGKECFWNAGTYRINTPLSPTSNTTILGVKGSTVVRQYGAYLFDFPENLNRLTLDGVTFDYRRVGGNVYDNALNLKAHTSCMFSNLTFLRYDLVTIVERSPTSAASVNTIFNTYSNWDVSACTALDVAIGLEGYYFRFQGDGSTTSIPTSVVWPEQLPGSVTVLKESSSRGFSELSVGTDFTVGYDVDNKLTVTLTAAPTSLERIHIWPSSTRTDGNRRPLSNNLWEGVRCLYVFSRGHQAVRWVDAETFRFENLLAAANGAKLYVTNPYTRRTGQGGDYAAFEDCIVGYQSALVSLPATLVGFEFGPGSNSMSGRGIRADQTWTQSGTNSLVVYSDKRKVQLSGTVSGTSGSPVVTGVGTQFRSELTLVGSLTVRDLVEVGGILYAIASIDSDTQITLSTNLTTSPSGAIIYRIAKDSAVDFDFNCASMGHGFYSTGSAQTGRILVNSLTERSGSATILSGALSVIVTHGLRRTPRPGELQVTAHSGLNGRSLSISSVGATTFQININTAAVADYTIGWSAKLFELN